MSVTLFPSHDLQESGDNIVDGDAGGSDTNYGSIWLVGWSDNTIHGLVPKHATAGIKVTDKGQVTSETVGGTGTRMEVYRTHFQMKAGLVVKDWRYAVRIPNIRRGELTADASSNSADLPDLMFSAMELLPSMMGIRPVFYMDRTIRTFLRKQLASKVGGSTLTFEDVGGRKTAMFQDIPIRRVDALSATESAVS